jgi:serine/threonine protein kinase
MDLPDPGAFGHRCIQLGLLTEQHLQDALEEARELSGKQNPDFPVFQRILERKGYMTPWQTGKVLKGDGDGFILGGYRILYKIKSGSFGRVFRADDPNSGRVVAIKILRRRWSEDQQRIDLFIREGRVGLTLKHPNIVEVLAMSQDKASGQYYIVMEFVEGGDLREILQIRKTLGISESLRLLEDMTSGLVYAHSQGLTHRDLKLTNVLISSAGEAKLVDFGLAQMFDILTREGEKMDRTVDYAGLERATGVPHGDVRSDIYFLGCIFYEMISGRSPLVMTRDKYARMRRGRFEEVEPLTRDDVDAPPCVFSLLETMMTLNPSQRYQTPSQLLDAVRAARREVDGTGAGGRVQTRSIFIVESNERLQDTMREKFKELGFRVLISNDPAKALDRFRQIPYDALIVNVGTTGEDGLLAFDQVRTESARRNSICACVAILSKEQANWKTRFPHQPGSAILVQPVTMKQLLGQVTTLMRNKK